MTVIEFLVGGMWRGMRAGRRSVLALLLCVLPGVLCAQEQKEQWVFALRNGSIISSSPAPSDDEQTIYVGVENRSFGEVAAISADGRQARWVRQLPDSVASSPAVGADGTVYIGCDDGKLYALNGATGATKWTIDTRTFIVSSPAIAPDGTIYFGAGDSSLYAVVPEGNTGRVKWRFNLAGDWINSSPAIGVDGTIYVGSHDKNVYAINPEDGSYKWHFSTGNVVDGSPAIGADGTIYIGSRDQKVYALSPNGTKKWEYFTNGEVRASPVLGADGTVYVASFDANFYALSPETGEVRWKVGIGLSSASPAAVRGDGTIIFGGDDGIVRALNPDGSTRWTYNTNPEAGDFIESAPLIGRDGAIYFGSFNGSLYKLTGNGSPLSEYSSWPGFRRDASRRGRALTVTGAASLKNLSARARVQPGVELIAGFFVRGEGGKAYLIRGVGPGLAAFGVADFLPDPRLQMYSGEQRLFNGFNDDWEVASSVVDTAPAVGAFPLLPGSKDAALVTVLLPGLYTAHVTEAAQRSGVALVEAYDAIGGDAETQLANLSTRGQVGVGEDILIVGLVVAGSGPTRVLVRAIGPGLLQHGVMGVLQAPRLSVFDREQKKIFETTAGWSGQGLTHDLVKAAEAVAAFPLQLGSADCARVLTLTPGSYTVQVSGLNGTTGEALAEIYVLP